MAKKPNTTSQRAIVARQREQQALKLRMQGMSYPKIGEALGVSQVAAYQYIKKHLEQVEAESAETAAEVKRIELERLDEMHKALWGGVLTGDLAAIDRALKIQERRAKLVGLDAAAKQEITGAGGSSLFEADLTNLSDEQLAQMQAIMLSAVPKADDAE